MDIALHRNHHLRLHKLARQRRIARPLAVIPLPVHLRHRMNVVRHRVRVHHRQHLPHLDPHHMRMKPAPTLVDHHRSRRHGKHLALQPALHIHKRIGQPTLAIRNNCLRIRRAFMGLHACRLIAHVDGLLMRSLARKPNRPRNRPGCSRIHNEVRGRRLSHLSRRNVSGLAATQHRHNHSTAKKGEGLHRYQFTPSQAARHQAARCYSKPS